MGRLVFFLAFLALASARTNKYERLKEVFEIIAKNETLLHLFQDHAAMFKEDKSHDVRDVAGNGQSFTCSLSGPVTSALPASVHQLTPYDIKVIAAMGDSLTAGNGVLAGNFLGVLVEYRGRTWSIGGDGDYYSGVGTLPNLLRLYNKDLYGYSKGYCDRGNYGCSVLNVADPGHTSHDMPDQANMLIERLRTDTNVDFLNDWKMITLFIGGNDLCDACNNPGFYSADNYISNIRTALDILYANVPRAFVNLVQIFDITPLAALSQGFVCNFITSYVCDCGKTASSQEQIRRLSFEYQQKITDLANEGRYSGRDDFAVVLQPFFKNTVPPRKTSGDYDLSYFAPDCFHFSEKGQKEAAKALWNNLLEPVGAKSEEWNLGGTFKCPSETQSQTSGTQGGFFRTEKN